MRLPLFSSGLAVLLLTPCAASPQGTSALVGTWQRVSVDTAGVAVQTPAAFAIYSANGYFSQIGIPTGRPRIAKPLGEMAKEELIARFRNVIAWRGTYRVSGDTLTRRAVAHTDPMDEGSDLVQRFRITGDTLILLSINSQSRSELRFVRVR